VSRRVPAMHIVRNDRTRLRADLIMGRKNELVERIALRLSIEPSVTSLSWSVVPTAME